MFNKKEIENLDKQLQDQKNLQQAENKIQKMLDLMHENSKTQNQIQESLNLHNQNNNYEQMLKEKIDHIEKVSQQYEKKLRAFEQVIEKLQKDMFSLLQEQLEEQLRKNKQEIKQYEQSKEQFLQMAQELKHAQEQVAKFNNISQSIKETDFSLVKHAKQIEAKDAEELKLMHQIEKLQRMIAQKDKKEH